MSEYWNMVSACVLGIVTTPPTSRVWYSTSVSRLISKVEILLKYGDRICSVALIMTVSPRSKPSGSIGLGSVALILMNLPGASPQVLCSAPTSPLTVLAFYICLRICKSGVSGIPCLSHYTKSEKLSCPSTISP